MTINEEDFVTDSIGRVRLFGIYQAIVDNTDDPLKQSRIQVRVQQPTGRTEVTGWAKPCLPVTDTANHPDHAPHLASQVAALLTTSSTSATGTAASGGSPAHTHSVSVTVPALTVVAKSGAGTLTHPHVATVSTNNLWNDKIEQSIASTAEHTPHRLIPAKGSTVWVMFEGGDPEYPVWMGVLSQK